MNAADEFRKLYLGEWTLPDWNEVARLAIMEYDRLADANEDPTCPQRPRRGGEPFHKIFQRVAESHFGEALAKGYHGTFQEWCQAMKDARPPDHRKY